MDFEEILGRAWKITWRVKGLWLLGILASCSGNQSSLSPRVPSGFMNWNYSSEELERSLLTLDRIQEETFLGILLAVLLLALLLLLLVFIFDALGRSSLIAGINQTDGGEAVSLGEALNLGLGYFWRLIGIQLIVVTLSLILILVLFVMAFVIGILSMGIGLFCMIPLLCVLVPIFTAFNLYINIVKIAVVTENLSIRKAFPRAWKVLKANPGSTIIIALILIVCGSIVSFVISYPLSFVGIPFATGLLIDRMDSISGSIISILLALAYLPFMLVLNGILSTFITSCWVLAYRRMIGLKPTEPLPLMST
jgi:hypothetical protein